MKTVFIVITRGFIIRNILRSGVLEHLTKANVKVVIFIANVRNKPLPKNLIEEFQSPLVTVEILPPEKEKEEQTLKGKLYSIFKNIVPFLVYSQSTWIYSTSGTQKNIKKNILWAYLTRAIFTPLSKVHFLKTLARFIDQHVFYNPVYSSYFDTYKPDVVFSTSIVSKHDIDFLKEAKRRKIKTVSMCKGWDNVSKILLRVLPDKMILQNVRLQQDMVNIQRMPKEKTEVTGFPQFDWYRRPEILMSREEFFARIGLSPDRRLIFFGSEGAWAPEDDKIGDPLVKAIQENAFVKPCSVLIRQHFSDINDPRFERFKNIEHVKLDDNYTISDFFVDNWDPGNEETKLFINSIYHSDLMIMIISTLALDAACFDKPIIGAAYNVIHNQAGVDRSEELYKTDHFQAVLETDSLDLVRSDKELVDKINFYLEHPEAKHAERKKLIDLICYKVDGKSSERLANVILDLCRL